MAAPDDDDAFAATVAPVASVAKPVPVPAPEPAPDPLAPSIPNDAQTPTFKKVVLGTRDGIAKPEPAPALVPPPLANQLSSDATMAAPVTGELPPLPEVSRALYETAEEIARGGMGRIVAAEDRRLGRPVALKELLDPNEDSMPRFQREALITARLQHPGIVPVYEAGRWPTGEPFFAMKLVSGRPLDQVIAATKTLPERLALLPRLAAACDAIAYAHSQRIIHRDLKPGNVLIGDFGETVVIDWGLAKDLDAADPLDSANRAPRATAAKAARLGEGRDTASSTLTVAGSVMGTPAYMAPEQARGEPVDQRADVFALGAMLYHVLAGTPPYNARTATDVIAAAALGKIVPLRTRVKHAPHDLVAILDRAMAPKPADRYPNAGELAEELRRFLTGNLVEAHRYTALQRVGRFVKKHRAAVTISAIAIAGFAIGGTLAVDQVVRERDRAEYENQIATTRKIAAERLIDYMFTHVQTQLTGIGRLDLMAALGAEVKHYYDRLSKIPGGMPAEDERRMAEAIELIGRAEHVSGKPDQALATWDQARHKLVALIGDDPHTRNPVAFELRSMIAKLDFESAQIYEERGDGASAHASFERARDEYAALHGERPQAREIMLAAADNRDQLGDLYRHEGKIDRAFDEYSAAKALRDTAASQGNGTVTDEVMALSASHMKLGSIYQARGDSQLALTELQTALRLRESVLSAAPDNVELQNKVIDSEEQTAQLESSLGDDQAAIAAYRRALPVMAQLQRRDPTNTDWQWQRGNLLADLGFSLIDSGEFAEGSATLERAIDVQHQLVARDPKSTRYQIALSRSYTRDGDAHLYVGQLDEAIQQYKAAQQLRADLVAKDPGSVAFRRSYAWAFAKLAATHAQKGETAKAIDMHEQARALRAALVVESPANGGFKNELAESEIALGALVVARDAKRGAALIVSGIGRARALIQADPLNLEWRETLVQGLLATGRAPGAKAARATALDEARTITEEAMRRTPQNVQWPGYNAEAHAGLAELGDPSEWARVREVLEPLAKAGRLPAPRLPLLERARAPH
ncbi:MAG: protein kinase [Kofleriaceae bacterium]